MRAQGGAAARARPGRTRQSPARARGEEGPDGRGPRGSEGRGREAERASARRWAGRREWAGRAAAEEKKKEEAGPVVGALGLGGEGKRRVGPKERMPGRFGLKEEGREREKLSNLTTSNSIQI